MKTLSDDYPVLFVSHGPPLVGVNDCPAHHFFKQLGREIAKPDAVLVISAHWESTFPLITTGERPGILYDFGGPDALHAMTYDTSDLDYRQQSPDPERSHPFPHEHLLPLFVAMGAAEGLRGRRLHDSFLFGTLSMAAYAWE